MERGVWRTLLGRWLLPPLRVTRSCSSCLTRCEEPRVESEQRRVGGRKARATLVVGKGENPKWGQAPSTTPFNPTENRVVLMGVPRPDFTSSCSRSPRGSRANGTPLRSNKDAEQGMDAARQIQTPEAETSEIPSSSIDNPVRWRG